MAMSRRDAARIAAHTRWAMEADRRAATSAGTNAFLARFEKQVDPDGLLPVDERQRRAQNALRAHMIMDQGTAQEVVPSQQQLPI